MSQLPVELLLAIVGWIADTSVLFDLRLASKTFDAVAAPLLFHVVTVRDSMRSAEGLACLQAGGLATLNAVQEIVFEGDPVGGGSWRDEHISGQAGRDALFAAFSGLTKLPNLRIICFNFHARFRELETTSFPDNPSHFLLLQLGLFAVLSANPPTPLASLALHNLIPMPHNVYATESFQNLFRPLTALDISILSEDGPNAYDKSPLCDFWEASIPSMLKSATNLTSLMLRSVYPIGVRPALPFAHIHFPCLTALSLCNFILDPSRADHDIVEFLVRHKDTLTHLELVDCCVYGAQKGAYPRPWHTVLKRFQKELAVLRSFQLLPAPPDWTEELEERFQYLYPFTFYYGVDDEASHQARDLDEAALQSLISAVKSNAYNLHPSLSALDKSE
ncbi:hypothetical protein K438DRAFT_1935752 [Mycena galopus ATCC 62051]|nr:hypothetical protein K438DRAFT_1935752 [Mycena galopus ATCC 62051]